MNAKVENEAMSCARYFMMKERRMFVLLCLCVYVCVCLIDEAFVGQRAMTGQLQNETKEHKSKEPAKRKVGMGTTKEEKNSMWPN